jgi:hypothetical protein
MKKSFLIPCGYKHSSLLNNISKLLEISTTKPEEVIIHISSCPDNFDYKNILQSFFNKQYDFKYEITKDFRDAGTNRNNLAEHSAGEILIYQDADDFFHPQRIELIQNSFQEKDILHLIHSYYPNRKPLEDISFQKICFNPTKLWPLEQYHKIIFKNKLDDYKNFQCYGTFENNNEISCNVDYWLHNGAISIKKEVLQKVKWKSKNEQKNIAEDQDFNFECFYHFNKSYTLLERIYYYNLNNRTNGGF